MKWPFDPFEENDAVDQAFNCHIKKGEFG